MSGFGKTNFRYLIDKYFQKTWLKQTEQSEQIT